VDGTRSALIIASDQYADPGLRQLQAPASDARALASVLRDPAIGNFEVSTLLNEPSHVVSLAVEDFFADRQPGDLLLLHFSGHGIKDQDGELYFAAPNTVLGRLGATAVPAEFVSRRMSRSRSRRVVLLLDCCYAGAFERGLVARAGTEVGIEQQFGGRGRAVITASSAMEYAFEAGELTDSRAIPPSVFTSALVQGLETGDADRDQDGLVGLDELYDYVYDRVRAVTPSQTPGKWTFAMEGELYIARRSRPVTTPATLPPELRQAIDSPLAGVRAGAVQELAAALRGSHAGMALAARLALEQLVNDDSRAVAAAATAALAEPAAAPPSEPVPPPVPASQPMSVPVAAEVGGPAAAPDVTTHPEPEPETPAAAEPGRPPEAAQAAASPAETGAILPVAEAALPDGRSPVAASRPGPGRTSPNEPRPRRVGRRRLAVIVSSAASLAVIGLLVAIVLISGQPSASAPGHPRASASSKSSASLQRLRWTYTTGGQVWSSPAVADGDVYVGSDDKKVYALTANGKALWAYATGGPVRSSPVVVDGVVYVGSEDGRVYALEAANGKLVWSYQTGGQVWSSPAVAGGVVYVGSNNGKVFALNAAPAAIQRLVWEYQTGGPVRSGPVVAGGVVYVGSEDYKVYALFAAPTATNRLDWSYLTAGWVVSNPSLTVSGGTVYVGSHDQYLYALGADRGNVLWYYLTGGNVDSRPAVVGDTVYVGSDNGYVYAVVAAAVYESRWIKPIGGFVVSGPAVVGDTVYVCSGDGKVYALNTANGNVRWAYPTGKSIYSSPVVAGGVLYVGSEDGKVYALNVS
jgi:outer membrane protein assembly factor BamB